MDQNLGHGTADREFTTITNVSAEGTRRRSTFEVEETDAFFASLNSATNGSDSGDTPGGYGDVSTLTNLPPAEFPV